MRGLLHFRTLGFGLLFGSAACAGVGDAGTGTAANADLTSDDVEARGTFTNPVFDDDCPDPGVVRVDAAFYMVCTGGGFRIRRSSDLVRWSDTGASIFPDGKAPWAADGDRNWAPEIHALGPTSFVV